MLNTIKADMNTTLHEINIYLDTKEEKINELKTMRAHQNFMEMCIMKT